MLNKILLRKIKFPLSLRGAFSHVIARERSDRSNRNNKGFSLIELMVALAILAMVSFGIFKAYTTSFQVMADAKDRTVAVNYAREILEKIKNDPNQLNYYFDYSETKGKYNLQVNVTSDPTDPNLNRVNTVVTWKNRDNKDKNVNMDILIYNPAVSSAPIDPEIARIDLYANPEHPLICEETTIAARVYDIEDNLIKYDVILSFFSNKGTLSEEEVFTSSGIATTTLNIPYDGSGNNTVTVVAEVAGITGVKDIDYIVPELSFEVEPSSMLVCDSAVICVNLTYEEGGDTIPLGGYEIEFTTNNGILNGEGAMATSSTSNGESDKGRACVTLNNCTYDTNEIALTAEYCGLTAQKSIAFETISTGDIVLEADSSIEYGEKSTITATVIYDGSPLTGKIVTFSTDHGMFVDSSDNPTNSVITNDFGIATIYLTGTSIETTAHIMANCCGADSNSVDVYTSPPSTGKYIILEAVPETVKAGGNSSILISIMDYSTGSPVVDTSFIGTIDLQISEGEGSITSSVTCGEGIGTAIFTSSVGFAGSVLIKAEDQSQPSDINDGYLTIQVNKGFIVLSADPTSLVNEETATITISVKDEIDGTIIDYSGIIYLSLQPEEGSLTDTEVDVVNGIGSTEYTAPIDWTGDVVINAEASEGDNLFTGTTTITIEEESITQPEDAHISVIDSRFSDTLYFDIEVAGNIDLTQIYFDWTKSSWRTATYIRTVNIRPNGGNFIEIYRGYSEDNSTLTLNRSGYSGSNPYLLEDGGTHEGIYNIRVEFRGGDGGGDVSGEHIIIIFNPNEENPGYRTIEFDIP
jgi:prepilin-type N-terminal cleavage/methylation domain-containing protein